MESKIKELIHELVAQLEELTIRIIKLGRLDFNSYQTFPLRVGAQAPSLNLSIPNRFPNCNHEKRYF